MTHFRAENAQIDSGTEASRGADSAFRVRFSGGIFMRRRRNLRNFRLSPEALRPSARRASHWRFRITAHSGTQHFSPWNIQASRKPIEITRKPIRPMHQLAAAQCLPRTLFQDFGCALCDTRYAFSGFWLRIVRFMNSCPSVRCLSGLALRVFTHPSSLPS